MANTINNPGNNTLGSIFSFAALGLAAYACYFAIGNLAEFASGLSPQLQKISATVVGGIIGCVGGAHMGAKLGGEGLGAIPYIVGSVVLFNALGGFGGHEIASQVLSASSAVKEIPSP